MSKINELQWQYTEAETARAAAAKDAKDAAVLASKAKTAKAKAYTKAAQKLPEKEAKAALVSVSRAENKAATAKVRVKAARAQLRFYVSLKSEIKALIAYQHKVEAQNISREYAETAARNARWATEAARAAEAKRLRVVTHATNYGDAYAAMYDDPDAKILRS